LLLALPFSFFINLCNPQLHHQSLQSPTARITA